jgi:hypothetical protein
MGTLLLEHGSDVALGAAVDALQRTLSIVDLSLLGGRELER